MPRLLKQLLYGAVYLLISAAILSLAYKYFYRAPALPPACPTCDLRIESDEVLFLSLGEETSSLLVKVKNPSADYGLERFDYQFKVFSKLGPIIKTVSGVSSLYPSEEKYIALSNVDIAERDIGAVKFDAANLPWRSAAFLPTKPRIIIENTLIETLPDSLRLTGYLSNDSDEIIRTARIAGVLLGGEDRPVAVSVSNLESIAPRSSRDFKIFLPKVNYRSYVLYSDILPK